MTQTRSEELMDQVTKLSYDPLVDTMVTEIEAGMRHVDGKHMFEIVDVTHKYGVSILDIHVACELNSFRRELEGSRNEASQ